MATRGFVTRNDRIDHYLCCRDLTGSGHEEFKWGKKVTLLSLT